MKYYVYLYLNPLKPGKFIYDDLEYFYEPFYVGKGKNRRKYAHLYSNKEDHNRLKINIINKILKNGEYPIIEILFESNSEEESYKKEVDIINIIGRRDLKRGPLSNMTNGGDGSNRIQTKEEKIKKSELVKNKIKNGILWGFFKPGYKETQEKSVLQFDINGNLIKRWNSIVEIKSTLVDVHRSHISACCRGLRKTHNGFIWKYEKESDISEYKKKKSKNVKSNGNLSRDKKMANEFGLDIETFLEYRLEKGPHYNWKSFIEKKLLEK